MRALPVTSRSVAEAIGLGPVLLSRARADAQPWIAASVVVGPAVLLGAVQRAASVVDMAACSLAGAVVWRRATTGTAVWVGGRAIVWSLALPRVNSLVPDATARTVLNRNVRGFLQGLSRAGAVAQYTGREWVGVRRRPVAIVGLEWASDGTVLMDLVAGWDESVALPGSLRSERERATQRWGDKVPMALGDAVGAKNPDEVAGIVTEAVAARANHALEWNALGVQADPVVPVVRPDDPVPTGLVAGPAVRVPIGWVDAAAGRPPRDTRAWLGGDILAGTGALAAVARGSPWGDAALEGAMFEDIARALVQARERASGQG